MLTVEDHHGILHLRRQSAAPTRFIRICCAPEPLPALQRLVVGRDNSRADCDLRKIFRISDCGVSVLITSASPDFDALRRRGNLSATSKRRFGVRPTEQKIF